jgi:NAD(P)H dehydrogenase (quinone)
MPIVFLRAGWFMENSVAPARMTGVVPSLLQPLDKPVPMVATADIGRVAKELLQECWSGRRVIELEGPHRVTPNEIAAAFLILGRHIRMEAVPRERWEAFFTSPRHEEPAALYSDARWLQRGLDWKNRAGDGCKSVGGASGRGQG